MRQQTLANLTFSGIFLVLIFLLASPFIMSRHDRNRQIERNYDKYQWFANHYERQYPRRVGNVPLGDGNWAVVRIQSIDGGKTWLVITKTKEVTGYLKDQYPHLDPYKHFEAVKGVRYGR